MKKIFCYFIIVLVCFMSCNENKQKLNEIFPLTNIKIPLEERDNISADFIDTVKFLKLNESENTFKFVGNLKIYNDTVYIYDNMLYKLIAFDEKGNFIRQYGVQGKSKNEYIKINGFDIDNNYVYLYDGAEEKMLVLTHEGHVKKSIKTNFWGEEFKVLDNGSFLFSLKPGDSMVKLCMTDSMFNIQKVFSYFDKNDQDNFSNYSLFQYINDSIYYTDDMCDTTYVFTSNGKLTNSYYFDFGANTPSLEERFDSDKLYDSRNFKKLAFMNTCPIIYKSNLIMLLQNNGIRTILYYNLKNRKGGNKDIDCNISLTDIIIPETFYDGDVVGCLDASCLERYKDKNVFPKDIIEHLEKGYRVLAFYKLKE